MGLMMGIVCCTGLFSGLLFRLSDPTEWMLKVGGLTFGVVALVLVAAANISASAVMMYTAGLALRHVKALRDMKWKTLTALAFLPLLAFVFSADTLYKHGNTFLAYNATMFVPISGVLLVDYLVLRGRKLNPSQIFESDPRGAYYFHNGFNWCALGTMAAGQALYLWLFNPVTNAHQPLFSILTASIPAAFLPMLAYWLLARLLLIPRGMGGYGADEKVRPLKEPNI
jgi:NCS1 family nucleobase:cation symporter-1